ncbi:MAG: site-2 protease family protein [Planctomycetota bacterium]
MNWELATLQFVTLIISLTFHEAGHAWFALLGGDRTAYRAGQVTINPLPHIQREPFGMLVLPILWLALSRGTMCFGFAHAPYDPYWADRHPKRAALMSFAGPLANLALGAVAFSVLWFVGRPDGDTEVTVRKIGGAFLFLNLLLALFNLVPLPPLDGAGIVRGLYPPSGRLFDVISSIPYGTLVVLVLLSNYIGELFLPVFYTVDRWLPYPLVFG